MLKRILRSQGGFTLIELLAVLAIISVLAGIVTAAVSGTKDSSEQSQVKSDGTSIGTSSDNWNTESKGAPFPDVSLAGSSTYETAFNAGKGIGLGVTLLDSQGAAIGTLADVQKSETGALVPVRRAIDFTATTKAQRENDFVKLSFVPDFLASQPASADDNGLATSDLDDNDIRQYLWLYRVTSPGSPKEARKVEAYRLSSAGCNLKTVTITADTSVATAQGLLNDTLFGDSSGKIAKVHATTTITPDSVTAVTTGNGFDTINSTGTATLSVVGATVDPSLTQARKALKDTQAILAVKKRELDAAQAVGGAVLIAATDANILAQVNVNNAQKRVVALEGLAGSERTIVTNALIAASVLQATATSDGIIAGHKCDASNKVINLSYKRVF